MSVALVLASLMTVLGTTWRLRLLGHRRLEQVEGSVQLDWRGWFLRADDGRRHNLAGSWCGSAYRVGERVQARVQTRAGSVIWWSAQVARPETVQGWLNEHFGIDAVDWACVARGAPSPGMQRRLRRRQLVRCALPTAALVVSCLLGEPVACVSFLFALLVAAVHGQSLLACPLEQATGHASFVEGLSILRNARVVRCPGAAGLRRRLPHGASVRVLFHRTTGEVMAIELLELPPRPNHWPDTVSMAIELDAIRAQFVG